MNATMEAESTEYVYIGVTGTPPSVSAEAAFLSNETRPGSGDWNDALLVTSEADPLWNDAVASGATGDYYVACLVGSFGDNTVVLAAGTYQVWIRLTDTTERPVRIAPTPLIIE